jgi:CDP-diacylglycerol--glycerol-3-phosphate 3-phosphatidyltransferase
MLREAADPEGGIVPELIGNVARKLAYFPSVGLTRLGVTPNQVTLFGVAMNIGVGAWLATGRFRLDATNAVLSFFLIGICGFMDAVDGTVARTAGKSTVFGAFLDSVTDRISDAALMIGLFIAAMRADRTIEAVACGIALPAVPWVSYVRARAEALGIPCKDGIFTRDFRLVATAIAVITGWIAPIVGILAAGSLATGVQRIVVVYQKTAGRTS